MPKISAYPNGGSVQSTDQFVINRGGTNYSVLGSAMGGSDKYPMEFRLTLESGVAVSTSDQISKSTLYLTPYNGNQIALYDGVSAWTTYTSAQMSIALASLTSGLPYDVFCYNNGGTPTLELLAWSSGGAGTSARATALTTQDGVKVKSGQTTRRYIGTIRTTATNTTEDSFDKRYVWNQYNRVVRMAGLIYISSHAYATPAWRAWNNNQASASVDLVLGEATNLLGIYRANNTVAGGGGVGFGVNTTSAPGGTKGEQFNNAADVSSSDMFAFSAGYNFWCGVEYGSLTTERISMTLLIEM